MRLATSVCRGHRPTRPIAGSTSIDCCLGGAGKRWTNSSAARFFGGPSAPGDFTNVGAPRWRQRAFYDAAKDAIPNRRLARISVHDPIDDGGTVERLLRQSNPDLSHGLLSLIAARTHDA